MLQMMLIPFQQRHRQPRHVRIPEQQPHGLLQVLYLEFQNEQ